MPERPAVFPFRPLARSAASLRGPTLRPRRRIPGSAVITLALLIAGGYLLPVLGGPAPAGGVRTVLASVVEEAYVVRAGDTLYAIAEKAGVAVEDRVPWVRSVTRLNAIDDADLIAIGQKLKLPGGAVASSSGFATASTTTYVVQPGDTLYAIAERQGVTSGGRDEWLKRVVALNGLADPDRLALDKELRLPAAATPPATLRTATYTVKPGDTLYGIAERQRVPEAELRDWLDQVLSLNKIERTDLLRPGDELRVPDASPGAPAPAAAAAQPAAAMPSTTAYTVRDGDTLYGIADRLGVRGGRLPDWLNEVVRLNARSDPDRLRLGEELRLPDGFVQNEPPATVTPQPFQAAVTPPPVATAPLEEQTCLIYAVDNQDTLAGIANKLSVPPEKQALWIQKVTAMNALTPQTLPVGDWLRLPCV